LINAVATPCGAFYIARNAATQNGAQRRGYKHSVHLWPRVRSGARSRRRCTSPRARRRRWGCSWRWSRRWPTRFRAVSSTCVEKVDAVFSAPDDHFSVGPHSRVIVSSGGSVHGAGGCPTIHTGIVFSASVEQARADPAPHDHFGASPHCRLIVSFGRGVGRVDTCPTIVARVVSPACIKNARVVSPAPDNHFIAGPDCRVNISPSGRVGGARGCPTIGARVVSPAGIE